MSETIIKTEREVGYEAFTQSAENAETLDEKVKIHLRQAIRFKTIEPLEYIETSILPNLNEKSWVNRDLALAYTYLNFSQKAISLANEIEDLDVAVDSYLGIYDLSYDIRESNLVLSKAIQRIGLVNEEFRSQQYYKISKRVIDKTHISESENSEQIFEDFGIGLINFIVEDIRKGELYMLAALKLNPNSSQNRNIRNPRYVRTKAFYNKAVSILTADPNLAKESLNILIQGLKIDTGLIDIVGPMVRQSKLKDHSFEEENDMIISKLIDKEIDQYSTSKRADEVIKSAYNLAFEMSSFLKTIKSFGFIDRFGLRLAQKDESWFLEF